MKDVRVLGMRVRKDFCWSREGNLAAPEDFAMDGKLTRRHVHQLIEEWLGHYPVCSWLRFAIAYVQRCTAEEGTHWDDSVPDCIRKIVSDIALRLSRSDPLKGL